MPNCTATQVPFAKLGRRKIDVRFDGGDVSSDGGLLLLRQVERRLGLLKAVAQVLPDPRNPWLVQHTTEQLLRQRVFGLCQGYEDLNDHDQLRDDVALQTALDRLKSAASSPTLCRFENRADRTVAVATQRILAEQFIASFSKAPEELVQSDTTALRATRFMKYCRRRDASLLKWNSLRLPNASRHHARWRLRSSAVLMVVAIDVNASIASASVRTRE